MPQATNKLRNKLKEEVLKEGIRRRYSPLGIEEHIIPENLFSKYLQPGSAAETHVYPKGYGPPIIKYNEPNAYDPDIQHHERIHAGQSFIKHPNLNEVMQALTPEEYLDGLQGLDTEHPEREIPAYLFANPARYTEEHKAKMRRLFGTSMEHLITQREQDRQNAFNKYIEAVRKYNPEGAPTLEAAMPDQLIRNYLKYFARPLRTPKVNVEEIPTIGFNK